MRDHHAAARPVRRRDNGNLSLDDDAGLLAYMRRLYAANQLLKHGIA